MAHKKLIHIGYHKTATTWLQRHLLDNPEANFKRFMSKAEIRQKIVQPHELDFNAEEVRAYYETLVPEGAEEVSVISSERLSGNPHSGGYDNKNIADRLYSVFPDAKVLIVVREQVDAIASCYLQHIKFGGCLSLKDYLDPKKHGAAFVPGFNFIHFEYNKLANYYMKLFGKDNVLVLPYELFKASPEDFCKKITDFAGAQALEELPFQKITNKRISSFSAKFLRHFNKAFCKSAFNQGGLDFALIRRVYRAPFQKMDIVLPKGLQKFFDRKDKEYIKSLSGERYKASNQELSELTGLDLTAYNYNS